jgi:hypothetical protein
MDNINNAIFGLNFISIMEKRIPKEAPVKSMKDLSPWKAWWGKSLNKAFTS